MTVESKYVIAIATLSDWPKRLALRASYRYLLGNCDWFIALPAPVVIGRSSCFGLLKTALKKALFL